MDSNTASRRNALAFRISTPINSSRSLSSTVMFGLSSRLRLSASSASTRWSTSSFSKYRTRVLFMRELPGSQPETNLLTADGVDCYGRDCISARLIRNHDQLPVVTADHHGQSRFRVE